jgi:hypothetical protein
MICRSNIPVVFINNPNSDPKLRLKPDPDPKKKQQNNFGSTTLYLITDK